MCKLHMHGKLFLSAMLDSVEFTSVISPFQLPGKESSFDSYSHMEISKCKPEMKVRKVSEKAGDVESHGNRSCNNNVEK